jgi:deazaflavin-dependent oxidoreductase (nitroreductase family)
MAMEKFRHAISGLTTIDLSVTGRSSGRQSKRPVNFVLEGETLYFLPLGGTENNWYKNVLKTPAVKLTAHGAADETTASPINGAAKVNDVVAKFRAKYGDQTIAEYYSKQDVAVQARI